MAQKQYSGQFKFKMALEATKEPKTISKLASETGVHPTQIGQWKRHLLEEGSRLFNHKEERSGQAAKEVQAELYEQIRWLKIELEWPKKSCPIQLRYNGQ